MIRTLKAYYDKDPSLRGRLNFLDVIFYPGLYATLLYRVYNFLYLCRLPLIPRFLCQLNKLLTGIEIHPNAKIGKRLVIDHGLGVIIGGASTIGDDVLIYSNVILGAKKSWIKDDCKRRHPTIGDNVVLGSNCIILGEVMIGNNAIIGAGAIVTNNVPANVTLIQKRKNTIIKHH